MRRDSEAGALTDRADAKAQREAARRLERQRWIMTCIDEQLTQAQHRRMAVGGDVEAGTDLGADQFGAELNG
jgi:hypothetical protein